MAIITVSDPTLLNPAYITSATTISTETSTLLSLSDPTTGFVENIGGVGFSYASNGVPVTGAVASLSISVNGHMAIEYDGLNFSVVDYINAINSNGSAAGTPFLTGGDDQVFGSTFGENIASGTGNDTMIALDGNDTVDGGDGNDDVNGNKGEDIVTGGAGNDSVRGGQGNDTVYGGTGDDGHVNGNIGDDIVHGEDGNDTVYGGQGNDSIYGDAGADHLSGDLGNDVMWGGTGADRFAIAKGGGFDWVGDFNAAEGDRIELAAGTHYTVANVSNQVAIVLDDGSQLGLSGVAYASFDPNWVVFV